LAEWSIQNLQTAGLSDALQSKEIQIITGDGRKGYASSGPYDAIHVGAAAPNLPQELIEQLARPGRMFIPVGTISQEIIQVDKDENGHVSKKPLFGVIYVPLTDPKSQTG